MSTELRSDSDVSFNAVAAARSISEDVAAPAASDVDVEARFPKETMDALRDAGLMGALVPQRYGGLGLSYRELADICTVLGMACSSSAMVFAMHNIQVSCVVEHGAGHAYFDSLLREIAATGRLLASATTEAGIGGDVRSSACAVVTDGDRFTLEKNAAVISYGEHVDDVLVTARRHPDSPASDQSIVHVQRPDLALEPYGEWDTLGMRGTCSIGFMLKATGTTDQIFSTPYSDVSSRTMLPVSHITWAALWLGIAANAERKAREFVRVAARKTPGTLPPSAPKLAHLYARIEELRSLLDACVVEFEHSRVDPSVAESMGFAVRMNSLKLSVSDGVLSIVDEAMAICGIAAYRNDTPYSLGRQLRDAHSARLMVHNDRIVGHNASLLSIMKGD
ncbi:MAG: acyl-CoA dehydrogenase family protein [Ilumatobacteraceae bacterium]